MRRLAAAAVAVCAAWSAQALDPIRIGLVLPFTGPIGAAGNRVARGVQLAATEINEAGGLNLLGVRVPVEIVAEDSTCNARLAVSASERMMSRDRVVAVIGDYCSSATAAVAELALNNQVPLLSPVSVAPSITRRGNPWAFRTCESTEVMARAFARYAVKHLNVRRWALLARGDEQGRAAVELLVPLLQSAGATAVAIEYHPHGTTEFQPFLARLLAGKPEGIALLGNAAEHVLVPRQLRKLAAGDEVKLLDPTSNYVTAEFLQRAGKAADGMLAPTRYTDLVENDALKRFVRDYYRVHEERPDRLVVSGYETMHILAAGIERAGVATPRAVRDALTRTEYQGLQDRVYQFDPSNQLLLDTYIMRVAKAKYTLVAQVHWDGEPVPK
jgi:branched-chain amino acid transport system substrate-binding protein